MKSETTPSPIDTKEKKRTFYDKRLIKKIVKEVEEDLPRSQAIAIYGMSATSLKSWMGTYGSASYQNSRPRKFKDSEKRTVVRAIESGMSIREAKTSFNISHVNTIKDWIRKFAKNADLGGENPVVMAKEPTGDALTSDEVRALQKALAEAELKIAGLNTLIDIAEEQLKIDIRKKSGARRSSK